LLPQLRDSERPARISNFAASPILICFPLADQFRSAFFLKTFPGELVQKKLHPKRKKKKNCLKKSSRIILLQILKNFASHFILFYFILITAQKKSLSYLILFSKGFSVKFFLPDFLLF